MATPITDVSIPLKTALSGDELLALSDDGVAKKTTAAAILNNSRDHAAAHAAMGSPRHGRTVKNMTPGNHANFNAGWSEVATNGTTNVTGITTVVATSNSTTCRVGRYSDYDFVAGRKYAISATLANVSGTFDHSLSTSCAQVGGGVAKNVMTGNGRSGFVFTANETASRVVRAGINPEASAACTNGATVTVSELLVEEIPSYQSAPSDYVPCLVSGEYDTESGNTLSSGIVTSATGVKRKITQSRMSLIIGDSLANDTADFGQLLYKASDLPVLLHATASTTLTQALADWSTIIALAKNLVITQSPTLTNSLPAGSYNTAVYVMERMINDIIISGLTFEQMKALYETWLANVAAIGAKTVIFGPTPCKGYASWSAGKQIIFNQLMAWLPERCAQTAYAAYFDRYSLLVDLENTDYLNPAFDLNYPGAQDFLHTNAAGGAIIAGATDAAVKALLARTPF